MLGLRNVGDDCVHVSAGCLKFIASGSEPSVFHVAQNDFHASGSEALSHATPNAARCPSDDGNLVLYVLHIEPRQFVGIFAQERRGAQAAAVVKLWRMADHRFLEFHDSKLLAVSVTPERAIVDLDAVIQTWDGTGSERRGTNWMQHVRLEILNPRVNNSITDLAAWIWDGRVVSRGLVDDDGDETLTVPLALDADVRLELENVRGERLEIFGTSLVVTVVAEARFLQNVPSDWDPDRASSE